MPKSYLLRKRELLRKVPSQFIFNYFLKCQVKSGETYKAPYREDQNPSYTIMFYEPSGKWKARDWALDEKYHDVFEMVKRIYKLDSFELVLNILERDSGKIIMWNRGQGYTASVTSSNSEISREQKNSYQTMDFTHDGERYWNFQSINTDTLEKFDVKQLRKVTYGENTFNAEEKEVFAYRVNGTTKIYQPNNKQYKFTYVKKAPDYVFGMEQLPEQDLCVVITGSEKEVMALYGMGIPAVAVESETSKLPRSLVKELKSRFKGVFILYDNDDTGRDKSQSLAKEHNLYRLKVPRIEGVKDFTEWVTFDGDAGGKLYEQMAEVVLEYPELLDNEEKEHDQQEAPPYNPNEPYILSWATRVKPTKPLLSIAGMRIGSRGNISALVSGDGSGKSSACELIACKLQRPDLEIGTIETPKKLKTLIIDTERSKEDVSAMFERICRRLEIKNPEAPRGFSLWAMVDMKDVELMKELIEMEIKQGEYEVLILDGLGDIVYDTNVLPESTKAVGWLVTLATKYNIVALTTLHTNYGNAKARGHMGSELIRKCESVLTVKSTEIDGEKVFSLTAGDKGTKLRNAGGKINMPFVWSEREGMMMPYQGEFKQSEKSRAKTEKEYTEIANRLFESETEYSHKEAAELLAGDLGVTYDTVRSNHLKKLLHHEILVQIEGKYYLNKTEGGEEEE
jgi:hypothetical protein